MDVVDLPHSDHGPRTATTVVLLHGFPLDHRMWRHQRAALEGAGLRVIVPDLRGAGKATLGRAGAGIREHAGDVLRLLERAGVRRAAVVGFSMGGYVALEVARQAPERLAGLGLVDTRAEADSDEARAGRAATIEKVKAQGMQALVDAMLPKMLTKDAPAPLVEEVRQMMLAQKPEGAIAALQALASRPDARPTLPQLRVPTLILVGQDDPITPPELSKAMAAAIAGARYEVIPRAAHLAPMEQPEATSQALLRWASSLR